MLKAQLSELSNHDIEKQRIIAQEESGIDYIDQDDLNKAVRSMHDAIEYMDQYEEGDITDLDELRQQVINSITSAFDDEFKDQL